VAQSAQLRRKFINRDKPVFFIQSSFQNLGQKFFEFSFPDFCVVAVFAAKVEEVFVADLGKVEEEGVVDSGKVGEGHG